MLIFFFNICANDNQTNFLLSANVNIGLFIVIMFINFYFSMYKMFIKLCYFLCKLFLKLLYCCNKYYSKINFISTDRFPSNLLFPIHFQMQTLQSDHSTIQLTQEWTSHIKPIKSREAFISLLNIPISFHPEECSLNPAVTHKEILFTTIEFHHRLKPFKNCTIKITTGYSW